MDKRNLSEQAAEQLLTYIKENELKAGDKLPNEAGLAKLLAVGRNTVREAVRSLASRNIVTIKQGAGTFINEKPGMVEDPLGFGFVSNQHKLVDDLMAVRLMVEPEIAALAAQHATEEEVEELEKRVLALETAINQKQGFADEDMAFHTHLANCSRNDVISTLIPIINRGVQLFAEEVDEQEFEQTVRSHRAILEAIRLRQPLAAKEAMTFHLMFNRNRMQS